MRKTKIIALFLILMTILSNWTPAAASSDKAEANATGSSTATLTITNPLPKATTIFLVGPENYEFYIPAGQIRTKTIEKGTYHFKYIGCLDKVTSGVLKYEDGKYEIDVKACKMIKWVIFNPSLSRTFTGELKGWINYQMTANPRQMQTYQIVAGPYEFTYSCGEKEYTLKVKPTKNKYWVMCN